ncbi:hypothetical protein C0993_004328 [Termitomyces sp. T159_Od127]|nr:hypothetical protein C0993_004328 [Termitomyces sp. T159_Od127]
MPSSIRSLTPDVDSLETPSPRETPFYTFLTRPVTPRLDGDSDLNKSKDAEYYLDTATFQVEGTLYKVAKYHFLQSQGLAAIFARCKSEQDVISLNNVSRDDFRTFLKLLYPLSIMSTNNFTTEEWIVVLKLSTRWKMFDIRNLAIRRLNVANIDSIDRIVLAQMYHIPQWMISSLVPLFRRQDSLSTDEATKLGFELALKICRIRDSSRILPDDMNDDAWTSAISAEFENELQLQTMSPVEQVVCARETGVFEFLRASYLDLVERPESLSNGEALELGCETTARICRIREQRIARNLSTMSSMGLVEDELGVELGTTTSFSAIQRVIIARTNVAQWLRTSLVEAVQRRQFSSDEVESLGKETMIRLFRVREAVYRTQWGKKSSSVCQTMVNKEFRDEIKAIRDRAKGYSGTEGASAVDDIVNQAELPGELIVSNAHDEEASTKSFEPKATDKINTPAKSPERESYSRGPSPVPVDKPRDTFGWGTALISDPGKSWGGGKGRKKSVW